MTKITKIVIGIVIIFFILCILCCIGGNLNNKKQVKQKIETTTKIYNKTKPPIKTYKPKPKPTMKTTSTIKVTATSKPTETIKQVPAKIENNLDHVIGANISTFEKYLNEKPTKNTIGYYYKRKETIITCYNNLAEQVSIDYESRNQKINKKSALIDSKNYIPSDSVLIKSQDKMNSSTDGQFEYYYKSKSLLDTKINNTGNLMIILLYYLDGSVYSAIISEGDNP